MSTPQEFQRVSAELTQLRARLDELIERYERLMRVSEYAVVYASVVDRLRGLQGDS